MRSMKITHSDLLDKIGSSTELAHEFGVTVGAISQWRTDGIPKARLMYLELKYKKAFKDVELIPPMKED